MACSSAKIAEYLTCSRFLSPRPLQSGSSGANIIVNEARNLIPCAPDHHADGLDQDIEIN